MHKKANSFQLLMLIQLVTNKHGVAMAYLRDRESSEEICTVYLDAINKLIIQGEQKILLGVGRQFTYISSPWCTRAANMQARL